MRLAAARRIEGGAVEGHPPPVGVDLDDPRRERTQVRIGEVEQLGGSHVGVILSPCAMLPPQRRAEKERKRGMKRWQKNGFGPVVVVVAAMAMVAAACGGGSSNKKASSGGGKTVTIGFVG